MHLFKVIIWYIPEHDAVKYIRSITPFPVSYTHLDVYKRQDQILAAVLKKNPRFINEPVYARRLEDEADKIVEQYAVCLLYTSRCV